MLMSPIRELIQIGTSSCIGEVPRIHTDVRHSVNAVAGMILYHDDACCDMEPPLLRSYSNSHLISDADQRNNHYMYIC